jgi:alpha-glucosidase
MRPVFMADPTDKSLRNQDEAFMWGDDLLIIPKWAENENLPKGKWRILRLDNTPDNDPYQAILKIREGAVVPVGPLIQHTGAYSVDSITLYANLNTQWQASGVLYHDEGNGFAYTKGDYVLYEYKVSAKNEQEVSFSVKVKEGTRIENIRYRIAWVKDMETLYSDWVFGSSSTLHMK